MDRPPCTLPHNDAQTDTAGAKPSGQYPAKRAKSVSRKEPSVGNLKRFDVPAGPPEGAPPPEVQAAFVAMTPHVNALFNLMPPGLTIVARQGESLIEIPNEPKRPPLVTARGAMTLDLTMTVRGKASAEPGDGPARET